MIFCIARPRQAEALVHGLTAAGFQVWVFSEYSAFMRAVCREKPALIITDGAIVTAEQLRREPKTAEVPMFCLVGQGQNMQPGADAYIQCPVSIMELVRRIRELLRGRQRTVTMGRLLLDTVEHRLRVGHRSAGLTGREYELLRLFLENPGRLFSREELLARLWAGTLPPGSRTVDVHIASLRRKIQGCGFCIRTLWGLGYRLEEQNDYA